MDNVNLFKLASQQAQWVTARQKVVANNIANVNTHGFTPSDVVSFKEVLGSKSAGMATTHASHIKSGVSISEYRTVEREIDETLEIDKKVRIEHELMDAGEVKKAYEINTAIVKAFHRMMMQTARST